MELNTLDLPIAQWLHRALSTSADLKHCFSASTKPPQVALPRTHMHPRSETNCTGTRLRQGWSVKKPQALVASDNSPVTLWSLFMKALPSNPGLLRYEQC